MTATFEEQDFEEYENPIKFDELNQNLIELVETVKESTNKPTTDNEKIDELIDFLQEKEKKQEQKELEEEKQKELEEEKQKQQEEKEEKELELIEHLLGKDELTEDEQLELDQLLKEEEQEKELQEEYDSFMLSNAENQEQTLEELLLKVEEVTEHLEEINAKNELAYTADKTIGFYGQVVIPAGIIIFALWKMLKPFIR